MCTLKFALGALVLLLGCLVILWPGVLTKPGLDETVVASDGADVAIESLLRLSDASEGEIEDPVSRSAAGTSAGDLGTRSTPTKM